MAIIVTRETGATALNRPLTNTEVDNNFINLNADIIKAQSDISTGAGIPKITGITITDSSYTATGANSLDSTGGYIKITGTGFTSGCQVLVNNSYASSVTFISSTEVRAQLPALSGGSYVLYLVLTNGSVAIKVGALSYSQSPTWSTTSPLSTGINVNIQLQATSDSTVTYSLASGSTLPAGLTLTSSGLLSGSVGSLLDDTTYTFTINATDLENQITPKVFTVNISAGDYYFNKVSLLLKTTNLTTQQNTTFLDSSANNFSIARNGTPTQGSRTPYWPNGQWSNYFSGSGDYIQIGSTPGPLTPLITAGAVLTIEAWVYPTSLRTGSLVYTSPCILGLGGTYFNFGVDNGLPKVYSYSSGVQNSVTSSIAVQVNTWSHIAAVFNGSGSNNLKIYVNGVLGATGTFSSLTWATSSGGNNLYIGKEESNPATSCWPGYISNLRIVNSATYTSNFTPSTTPLTPITNTTLLTCQSNRFRDNSSNNFTLTPTNTPQVQIFQPFSPANAYTTALYGGSAYFNGSTDYLSLTPTSAFNFSTNNWTIEMWVNLNTVSAAQVFLSFGYETATQRSFILYLTSANVLQFAYSTNGSNNTDTSLGASGFTVGTWNHLAIVRNGATITIYRNGVAYGTTISIGASSINYTPGAFRIAVDSTNYTNGYISNFRIVNGTAVYTAAFTPPTAPVTAITNTSLLLNFTNAGIYDASAQNVVSTLDNAQVNSVQYKWSPTSIKFDGSTDYLTIPANYTGQFGTSNFTIEFWQYYSNLAGYQTIMSTGYVGTTTGGWLIQTGNGDGKINFYYMATGGVLVAAETGTTVVPGTWYYIAIVKSGSTTTIYRNGTVVGSGSDTRNYSANQVLSIGGGSGAGFDNYWFNGYIQDVRITKGINRTKVTTVPSTEFPNQGSLPVPLSQTPTQTTSVEFLVVGGGGAGGLTQAVDYIYYVAGGGGAGGFRQGNYTVSASTSYQVTVGEGGSSSSTAANRKGKDSQFHTIVSTGGGAGGEYLSPSTAGGSGGGQVVTYGGGSAGNTPAITPVAGETTTVQGYSGGNGPNGEGGGGGGGGAGASGLSGQGSGGTPGGNGGNGLTSSITGTSVYYAGGGGGGGYSAFDHRRGSGGLGGGGIGAFVSTDSGAGTDGLGGGAGGGNRKVGGRGVVIIAYSSTISNLLSVTGTLTYTLDTDTRTGYRIYTFTSGSGTISW